MKGTAKFSHGWMLREQKKGERSNDLAVLSRPSNGPPSARVAGMLPWLEWVASGEYVPAGNGTERGD